MNSRGVRPVVALTGATGFIGHHLLSELPKRGYRLRVLLRRPSVVPLTSASAVIGDFALFGDRPQDLYPVIDVHAGDGLSAIDDGAIAARPLLTAGIVPGQLGFLD